MRIFHETTYEAIYDAGKFGSLQKVFSFIQIRAPRFWVFILKEKLTCQTEQAENTHTRRLLGIAYFFSVLKWQENSRQKIKEKPFRDERDCQHRFFRETVRRRLGWWTQNFWVGRLGRHPNGTRTAAPVAVMGIKLDSFFRRRSRRTKKQFQPIGKSNQKNRVIYSNNDDKLSI